MLTTILFHKQKKDVRMLRFIQEVNTTTRSCALWDLEEETDYIVHVQSISMSGTSPASEPLRFRTPKEAETQASKSKGKAEHGGTQLPAPRRAEGSPAWLFDNNVTSLVQNLNKINRHTKREMKFHDEVPL